MCYIVLIVAAINLILALFFERFVVQYMMEEKEMVPKCLKEKRVRKTPHLMIKRQLTDSDYMNVEDMIKYEKEMNGTVSDLSNSLGDNSMRKS